VERVRIDCFDITFYLYFLSFVHISLHVWNPGYDVRELRVRFAPLVYDCNGRGLLSRVRRILMSFDDFFIIDRSEGPDFNSLCS
jgi:hypothetical protein